MEEKEYNSYYCIKNVVVIKHNLTLYRSGNYYYITDIKCEGKNGKGPKLTS